MIDKVKSLPNGEWFLNAVDITDSCWLWTKYTDNGYGILRCPVKKKNNKAHRWIMIQLFGEPPIGKETCHRCSIRSCVNPDHLYYGTRSENQKDSIKAGTHNFLQMKRKGIDNANAVLTIEQVRSIRLLRSKGLTYRAIAETLGLNINTVGNIICGTRHKETI